jgi:hypothetical protein
MARVLTPAAATAILELHEEKDSWGRPLHSQGAIAEMLGVSETTVFRVIHRRGAYGNVKPPKTDEDAAASLERLQEMLKPAPAAKSDWNPYAGAKPNPFLDIPDAFDHAGPGVDEPETTSGLEKLQQLAAEKNTREKAGDLMLDELAGD